MSSSAPRAAVGRYGERVAAEHLRGAGLVVLDRNWRCRWGELDLVARDGDCLVGVEVKTRRSTACGSPLEAITPAKVARLRRLLGAWLAEHPVRPAALRLDAVAVLRPPSGPALVEHVRGIG
ncbi:YraN family protein [Quadrisphaera sp. DSM 44207]|uniref:YraN family protein n=1 Tax=Quadrisphaera sp. DSM 44207 TaxID=1881057 RepID=UPI00087EE6DA|nr:YraN family protein [Quadrisphaera sp. DSM 44207]SDQ76124.1 putative endonuclease [Quadrisphaera sp. DSM 44207]